MTYVKMFLENEKKNALILDRIVEAQLASLPTGRLKLRAVLLGQTGMLDLFIAPCHQPEVPGLNLCWQLNTVKRSICCFFSSFRKCSEQNRVLLSQLLSRTHSTIFDCRFKGQHYLQRQFRVRSKTEANKSKMFPQSFTSQYMFFFFKKYLKFSC